MRHKNEKSLYTHRRRRLLFFLFRSFCFFVRSVCGRRCRAAQEARKKEAAASVVVRSKPRNGSVTRVTYHKSQITNHNSHRLQVTRLFHNMYININMYHQFLLRILGMHGMGLGIQSLRLLILIQCGRLVCAWA